MEPEELSSEEQLLLSGLRVSAVRAALRLHTGVRAGGSGDSSQAVHSKADAVRSVDVEEIHHVVLC